MLILKTLYKNPLSIKFSDNCCLAMQSTMATCRFFFWCRIVFFMYIAPFFFLLCKGIMLV